MTQNVFLKCIDGIVKESFAGGDKVKHDWNTSIDMFDAKHHITAAIGDPGEIARQRGEFLNYVKDKTFGPDGKEIKKKPQPLTDEYEINGEKIKITGDMIRD